MSDPKLVFSTKVDNYIKYRPTYPSAILDLLIAECGLTSSSVIADVGSGTGILTELFLKHGNAVFGIEPNREMRSAAERQLAVYPHFKSVEGTAEATLLATGSIDIVTAGQAFHWFEPLQTRAEFVRILKVGGWVVLIWNIRRTDTTPFLQAFEQCWQHYATDTVAVQQQVDYGSVMDSFFGPGAWHLKTFENIQRFDFEGLKGRVLSASLAPEVGHPNYEAFNDELNAIFLTYQINGVVDYEYDAMVYYGQVET